MSLRSSAETPSVLRCLDRVRSRLLVEAESSPEESHALDAADLPITQCPAGSDLTHKPGPLFIASGWACRVREIGESGRQILGFILPGDAIGLRWTDPAPPHRTIALTSLYLLDGHGLTGLDRCLARSERAEHHRHLDHTVRLGALSAYEAMCHFLTELHDRLQQVGLAQKGRFELPVAQDVLGDALGISEVHANRILSQLKRDGLLELGPGWAALPYRA
jgi:CRP-like cAMP-binding protein